MPTIIDNINLEKIAEEEKYDGFYAIATNLVGAVKMADRVSREMMGL